MTLRTLDPRAGFVRLLHRRLDLAAFFEVADRTLARLVPFDSSCWLSLDPATLLPTSHFTREVDSDHLMELAANEFLEDDVNKFAVLARAARPVGILSEATEGNLRRSPRFTRILAPHGYQDGDELRATFLEGGSAWGCVALHRRSRKFEPRDADVVADVGGHIGEGIRRAILASALEVNRGPDLPGLVLLRADDSVESITPAARRWLGQMYDSTTDSAELPLIVVGLAGKARLAGSAGEQDLAKARVPTKSGAWLILYASFFDGEADGRVAVMVHPAKEPEIAPLIVEAYGLSRREREVTRLVLYGLRTRDIAGRLHLSPYTVQDHLKTIFFKVGVRSRRELVAQLFVQHYAPRIGTSGKLRSDGWFAEGPEADDSLSPG